MVEDGDVVRLRGKEVDVQFAQTVASNLPAVMVGAVELWPAFSRWDPATGGLEYLKSLTGTTRIQVITSKSSSVFYGQIKGHKRVSLMFGNFIDIILSESKMEEAAASPSSKVVPSNADNCSPQETSYSSGSVENDNAPNMELYLAQVPIYGREEGETMLSPLMQDISTPSVLEGKEVSNINLWMSMKSSRSSTHYDPYHNILCVVAGEKRVTLWPPSETPYLYPLPIHGEASNHSGVDIVAPNYDMHPLFRKALQNAKVVTLQKGDALFIPEGWYHQVDNVGITIAVNFWWPSKISSSLGSQMDGYILRRVISSLLDREKKRMLKDGIESCTDRREAPLADSTSNFSRGKVNLSASLADHTKVSGTGILGSVAEGGLGGAHTRVEDFNDLTAEEALHLKTLVTCALGETTMSPSAADSKSVRPRIGCDPSHHIEDDLDPSTLQRPVEFREDPLCRVFATLGALSLQRVLLVMATQFPRSLRVLVMDMLSPAAAELLTMKFEELDGLLETSLQPEFYEKFYSVFESPEAVMAILLEKKEEFAAQALQNVVSQFLGLSCCLVRG